MLIEKSKWNTKKKKKKGIIPYETKKWGTKEQEIPLRPNENIVKLQT